MEPSARLFQCARCYAQVILCRACDRGQVYCGNGCASAARWASLGRAGARYRGTRRGRHNNAERQRRFRARHQKRVHSGCVPVAVAVVLTVPEPPPGNASCAGLEPDPGTLDSPGNTADRPSHFRAGQQKVTHQGSAPGMATVVLAVTEPPPGNSPSAGAEPGRSMHVCHRCARPVSAFLRRDFLRSTARRRDPP